MSQRGVRMVVFTPSYRPPPGTSWTEGRYGDHTWVVARRPIWRGPGPRRPMRSMPHWSWANLNHQRPAWGRADKPAAREAG